MKTKSQKAHNQENLPISNPYETRRRASAFDASQKTPKSLQNNPFEKRKRRRFDKLKATIQPVKVVIFETCTGEEFLDTPRTRRLFNRQSLNTEFNTIVRHNPSQSTSSTSHMDLRDVKSSPKADSAQKPNITPNVVTSLKVNATPKTDFSPKAVSFGKVTTLPKADYKPKTNASQQVDVSQKSDTSPMETFIKVSKSGRKIKPNVVHSPLSSPKKSNLFCQKILFKYEHRKHNESLPNNTSEKPAKERKKPGPKLGSKHKNKKANAIKMLTPGTVFETNPYGEKSVKKFRQYFDAVAQSYEKVWELAMEKNASLPFNNNKNHQSIEAEILNDVKPSTSSLPELDCNLLPCSSGMFSNSIKVLKKLIAEGRIHSKYRRQLLEFDENSDIKYSIKPHKSQKNMEVESFFTSSKPLTHVQLPKRQTQKKELPQNFDIDDPKSHIFVPRDPREDHNKIEYIFMGGYIFSALYYAPWPDVYLAMRMLPLCSFCLMPFCNEQSMMRHQITCYPRHPPGKLIYQDGTVAFFEIDGPQSTAYAKRLCYLGKTFIENKTNFAHVSEFRYYVLCEKNNQGFNTVGYFSKEKISDLNCNLSCILTLPPYQNKGYGSLMIDMSYLLSRVSGVLGSPEHPISDTGLIAYRTYWREIILGYILDHFAEDSTADFSVEELETQSGIVKDDLISTMQYCGLLKIIDGTWCAFFDPNQLSEMRERRKKREQSSRIDRVKPQLLQWSPPPPPTDEEKKSRNTDKTSRSILDF